MNEKSIFDKFNYLTSYNPSIRFKELYDKKQDLFYGAWIVSIELNEFEETFWERELENSINKAIEFIESHKLEN